jgi:hypothetical protein
MAEKTKTTPQEASQPTTEQAVSALANTITEVERYIHETGAAKLLPILQRHSVPDQLKLSPGMSEDDRQRVIRRQHDIIEFTLTSAQSPLGARRITPQERQLEWTDKLGTVRTRLSRVNDLVAVAESYYVGHEGNPLQLFTELWVGKKTKEGEFLDEVNGHFVPNEES